MILYLNDSAAAFYTFDNILIKSSEVGAFLVQVSRIQCLRTYSMTPEYCKIDFDITEHNQISHNNILTLGVLTVL